MKKMQLIKILDNIWYYYKVHILIGILVLAGGIPAFFFTEHEKESALNVTFVGNSIGQSEQETLQKRFTAEILKGDSKSEIKLNFWQVNGNLASAENMDLYQKFLAGVAAKEIDIIALDRSDLSGLSKQVSFKELSLIKESDKIGLDLTGNKLLRNAGYNPDNKIMAILSNTEKEKTALQFIRWFEKQK